MESVFRIVLSGARCSLQAPRQNTRLEATKNKEIEQNRAPLANREFAKSAGSNRMHFLT